MRPQGLGKKLACLEERDDARPCRRVFVEEAVTALKELKGCVGYLPLQGPQVVRSSVAIVASATDVDRHRELEKTVVGVMGFTGFKLSEQPPLLSELAGGGGQSRQASGDHGLPSSVVHGLPLFIPPCVTHLQLARNPLSHGQGPELVQRIR